LLNRWMNNCGSSPLLSAFDFQDAI
jgi:hypothetical protein